MKIFIGTDHRGYKLTRTLEAWLKKSGFPLVHAGAKKFDPKDDYVEYAQSVAEKVAETEDGRGIVICGSGVGVDIVANKVRGIRCGLGFSQEQVKEMRSDDNVNVLALAADFTPSEKAEKLVKLFLETPFSGEERHKRRIEKISKIDHQ